jgi:hypothetical protein
MKNKNRDNCKARTAGGGSEKQEGVILAMSVDPKSQLINLEMAWANSCGERASVKMRCVLLSFATLCYVFSLKMG